MKLETNHGVTGWGDIDEAKLDELSKNPPRPWTRPTRGRFKVGGVADY